MAEPPKRTPIVERARWFQLTEAASVGIEMAAAIGVGGGLGLYLQRNVTHWAPWTLYIGLGIGLGAAAIAVVRTARNFTRVIEAEEAAEREKAAQAHDDPLHGPPGLQVHGPPDLRVHGPPDLRVHGPPGPRAPASRAPDEDEPS